MSQSLNIEGPVKFLALGDSYTFGESVAEAERWPVQLNDRLKAQGLDCAEVRVIATTGWRTDDLRNAMTAAQLRPEYTLVSLLIGVNNYYQGRSVESYEPEFEALLKTAIGLAGGHKSRVFVVSIPDYGYTPFGQPKQAEITQGIDAYNAANKRITDALGIAYFNITDISRQGFDDPALVAGDGLHPSGKMYKAWVDLILKKAVVVKPRGDAGNGPVTGIGHETFGIKVYPNPFHDVLHLEGNSPEPGRKLTWQLVTADGQVAFSRSASNGVTTIETRIFSAGTYLLSLQDRETRHVVYSRKLIKL